MWRALLLINAFHVRQNILFSYHLKCFKSFLHKNKIFCPRYVFSTYTIWTTVYVIWLLDIWGKMFTRAGSPLSRDTSGYMKVQRLNMFQSNGFYFYLHTCVVLCWCSINPNIQIASSNSLPFTVLSLFICFKALLVIIVIYHKILTFCFLLCKEKVVYVSVAD